MSHMFQKKRSVVGPFLEKNNQMIIKKSQTRLMSPDVLNQSLTSYPATNDRLRWPSKPHGSTSINDKSSIVSKFYDIKESPRGFRYADSAIEKYIKNVVINSEYDTEPCPRHNQQTFGRVLREDSRDNSKILNQHFMHLKSYMDVDRVCN